MSLKASLSIVLHLHQFRNIALPHKARFALRAIIYQATESPNFAMPFNMVDIESKPRKNVSKQGQFQDNYFQSKKFNIMYQDQDIELNDCCEFKFTLQAFPQFKEDDVYIEFILMENGNSYFREGVDAHVEMKPVERYRFKLEDIKSGIFRYCQGEFNEVYISSFSFTLFAMVTEFRFHPYNQSLKSDSQKYKARAKVSNIFELMKWAQKYVKNCENGGQFIYKHYVKSLRYNSSVLRAQMNDFFKSSEEIKLFAPLGEGGSLIQVNDKQFFDYMTSYFPEDNISEQLVISDIHLTNVENFEFVEDVKRRMSKGGVDMKLLKQKYRTQKRDMFGERVFRSIVYGKQPRNKQSNLKVAGKMRKKDKMNEMKIFDEYLFFEKKNQHYAFLEVNLPQQLKIQSKQSSLIDDVLKDLSIQKHKQMKSKFAYDQRSMLVILVHGFQASSFDMQLIKREISKMLPVAVFLVSSANQMDTDGDISLMGFRLAEQVKSFIAKNFEDEEVILNFVGHSMGGVIARAALSHLQRFKHQMGFFFSLSSPHLGYLNGVDTMVKTGLWFMRKMNKLKSLDQLSMQDTKKWQQSFLFKLSKEGHLRYFNKIILVSSSEDSYVAWHSARIQQYDSNNKQSKIQREMVESILGQSVVHRIDIHFDIETTKNVDSFIGRTAHINLLTHECLFKLVNAAIPSLFDIRVL